MSLFNLFSTAEGFAVYRENEPYVCKNGDKFWSDSLKNRLLAHIIDHRPLVPMGIYTLKWPDVWNQIGGEYECNLTNHSIVSDYDVFFGLVHNTAFTSVKMHLGKSFHDCYAFVEKNGLKVCRPTMQPLGVDYSVHIKSSNDFKITIRAVEPVNLYAVVSVLNNDNRAKTMFPKFLYDLVNGRRTYVTHDLIGIIPKESALTECGSQLIGRVEDIRKINEL